MTTSTSVPTDWDLEPGDEIRRVDLHGRWGGNRQSGIASSRSTDQMLLFSEGGGSHGYADRWSEDGTRYLYAGEGQTGNQALTRGNLAVLSHKDRGKHLRLFQGAKGVVTYVGEFEVDENDPYHWETSHQSGGLGSRQILVFHLKPVI